MAEKELGRLERPQVDHFAGKKKLLLVPLLFAGDDAPQEFTEKLDRYWQEVATQVQNLAAKLGGVSRIYHEMIFSGGEEGLDVLRKLSPRSHQAVVSIGKEGAEFHATEDRHLAEENTDWERCLMVTVSQQARDKIATLYLESSRKRCDYISQRIEETLAQDEVGVLFIREGHRVQFPRNTEVFNVHPPTLDEINRWLREPPETADAQDES